MPSESRPGRKGFYVELPDELDAELRAFVERYPLGTLAQHVRLALRRHMDSPPVVSVSSLPSAQLNGPLAEQAKSEEVPRKRGRPRKT